jgi:ketosteroid isomerase-like protein
MTQRVGLAALAAVALAGCAHSTGSPPASDATAQVMRLDAAWAEAVARGDAEGFRALVAEDAIFAGRALLRGREEVWSAWKGFFADGGPRLRWTPTAGGAAGSGDLAWTTGRYRLERRGPDGKPAASDGQYLTIWVRHAGDWRVALDCGLEPADALGPVERVAVHSHASEDGKLEAAMGTWTQDGPSGRRSGAWIAVREKAGEEWRTIHDGAVEFPPAG